MRFAQISLALATIAGAAVVASAPAVAEEEPPPGQATITQVRPTVLMNANGAGTVLFHYTCSSPDGTGHLYVAVKQGRTISPENTSSTQAVSYSSTNWMVDDGANALVCDGKKHVMRAQLQRDPWFPATAPALTRGRALLQICIYDATGLSLDYSMRPVVRTGPRG